MALTPAERSLSPDGRGHRLGALEVGGMTRARDHDQMSAGNSLAHRLRDLQELLVTLADEQQHGYPQLPEAMPHRWQGAGTQPAQRPCEPLRGVAQSVGVDACSDLRWLAGQYRRSRPARRKGLHRHPLDLASQLLIGLHTRRSLRVIRDSRRRPDEYQAPDPRRSREGILQGDTASHRVAPEHKPPGRDPIEV